MASEPHPPFFTASKRVKAFAAGTIAIVVAAGLSALHAIDGRSQTVCRDETLHLDALHKFRWTVAAIGAVTWLLYGALVAVTRDNTARWMLTLWITLGVMLYLTAMSALVIWFASFCMS